MLTTIRASIVMLLAMTILTGVIYPAVVTGIAQVVFPHQANGSLIPDQDKAVGSELIGQSFSQPEYFWGRLSATGPVPYNAASSSGSNLGPLNEELKTAAQGRINALRTADPSNTKPVPVDLITSSGSGLDPHISPAAAEYQVPRVAAARKMKEDAVRAMVAEHTQGRTLGVLGERRVNVLQLNLALDRASATK